MVDILPVNADLRGLSASSLLSDCSPSYADRPPVMMAPHLPTTEVEKDTAYYIHHGSPQVNDLRLVHPDGSLRCGRRSAGGDRKFPSTTWVPHIAGSELGGNAPQSRYNASAIGALSAIGHSITCVCRPTPPVMVVGHACCVPM